MTSRRQTTGDETSERLLNWTKGQKAPERLAAHILAAERFISVDPSHPLGGPDGLKDIICSKDELSWIGAAYFPIGKQTFSKVNRKFTNDFDGVSKNRVEGFIFITNQYLTEGQRKSLDEAANIEHVEIYHLERIS